MQNERRWATVSLQGRHEELLLAGQVLWASSQLVMDVGVLERWQEVGRGCQHHVTCPLHARLPFARRAHASSSHRSASTRHHAATMPSSDYTSAAGGALKLKGGRLDKKKKKKMSKPANASAEASTQVKARSKSPSHTTSRSISPDTAEKAIKEDGGRKKTEAEKRHDEKRRKRLEDRLKKEGVKTHKEKVEELNKYLSGLSEHHDMPKIGPG